MDRLSLDQLALAVQVVRRSFNYHAAARSNCTLLVVMVTMMMTIVMVQLVGRIHEERLLL